MCQTLFSDKGEEVVKEATRHIYSSFKSFETYEIRANDDRWIKFSHRPIGNQAIGGVGIEITDLKKKQKELSHTKTGLENLIETLDFGLLVIDDDGNVSVFNPAYQEYCHSIGIEVTHDMSLKDLSKKFIDAGFGARATSVLIHGLTLFIRLNLPIEICGNANGNCPMAAISYGNKAIKSSSVTSLRYLT